MPFSSNSLRRALCTLPFHSISWHFHPSTGNAHNFALTHKSRSSRLSFLQLCIHRTFESELNTMQELFLFLSKMDTLHSHATIYGGWELQQKFIWQFYKEAALSGSPILNSNLDERKHTPTSVVGIHHTLTELIHNAPFIKCLSTTS